MGKVELNFNREWMNLKIRVSNNAEGGIYDYLEINVTLNLNAPIKITLPLPFKTFKN